MEEKSKIKDLEEDEELKSLRLAALATLKPHRKHESTISDYSLPINKIITIPSNTDESDSGQIPFVQSDRNSYNSHSWRKQNQISRRRGGGGLYPKTSHRSNLIVISPVSLETSKDCENRRESEKQASMFMLPQHKWCNSGNEDSMSPKTLRHTGPTRFNRHGSDSESSDSDYEDSDNDSASNETVLQDEPSEHFTRMSSEIKSDAVTDNVEKKRRLSFQSLEPNIKADAYETSETTSVYNCLKVSNSSYNYSDRSGGYTTVQNQGMCSNTWGPTFSSYNQYSNPAYSPEQLDSSMGFHGNHRISDHVNNREMLVSSTVDNSVWQHTATGNSYYTRDTTSMTDSSRIHNIGERERSYSDRRNSIQNEIQGINNSWQHVENTDRQYFSEDKPYLNSRSSLSNSETLYSGDERQSLSQCDLRLELKKRIEQEYNSKREGPGNQKDIVDIERHDKTSSWSNSMHRYSQQDARSDDSHRYRNNIDQTYDRFRNEHSSRRRERSLSFERRDHSLSRDKCGFDFDFDRGKNKHENSYEHKKYGFDSSHKRDVHERSYSRDRSEPESCSTEDQSSHEHSSSQERSQFRCNSSYGKRSYKHSSSREGIKSDYSSNQDRKKQKHSLSPNAIKLDSNQEKVKESSNLDQETKDKCNTNQDRHAKSVSDKYDKTQWEFSLNQDKEFEHRISHDRNRHNRSVSHDRSRHDRSSSRSKSRPRRSLSKSGSRHHARKNHHCHDEDKYEGSSSHGKSKYNNNQDKNGKNRQISERSNEHEYTSDDDKDKLDLEERRKQGKLSSNERPRRRHEQMKERNKEKYMHQHSKSTDKWSKDHSRSPVGMHRRKSDNKEGDESSQSRNSSRSSSSSSSSSSYSSKLKLRSVPSVIKSVPPKNISISAESRITYNDLKSAGKNYHLSTSSQSDVISQFSKRDSDHSKLTSMKSAWVESDLKNNASENNKRMPVHMRLGTLPRKRVIQMTKDVEAAFVNNSSNSSSDNESVSTKSKKQNIRIFTDVCGNKSGMDSQKNSQMENDKSLKNSTDTFKEKSRRLKSYR